MSVTLKWTRASSGFEPNQGRVIELSCREELDRALEENQRLQREIDRRRRRVRELEQELEACSPCQASVGSAFLPRAAEGEPGAQRPQARSPVRGSTPGAPSPRRFTGSIERQRRSAVTVAVR